jgi:hypothetical protein
MVALAAFDVLEESCAARIYSGDMAVFVRRPILGMINCLLGSSFPFAEQELLRLLLPSHAY